MEPLFVCIVTDRVQKGDQKSGGRQKPRWIDGQDSSAGRCVGQPCALPSYAREARETTGVAALFDGLRFGVLPGDKANDADWLRRDLLQCGAETVVPLRVKRLTPADYDEEKYKWRHLIENFFQRLKKFRGIAIRSCKTDSSFEVFIYLAVFVLHTL